ncbi:bile acid:sodium symporter [Akkermansia muciniphila]|nr:bile acid:sodium symporter [Akkermansia muciniphila]
MQPSFCFFFLYGAKLSRRSVWEGLMHWRLQGLVAASTFVIFPLLGMVSMPLWNSVLGPDLCMGMLYVCMLPSTVQSSIAFTSMAGGNVAAAICSASVSSLLGCSSPPCWWGWCGPAEGKEAWIFPLS